MKTANDRQWLTSQQTDLLRASFVRLIPACESVSETIYATLFERHPELKPRFPQDMQLQQEKLVLMLASAVDMLKDRKEFETTCAELGRRHLAYGAVAAHYPIVATLTLEAIGDAAAPPLSPEERESWELLFDLIGTSMLSGASQTEKVPPRA